MTASNTQPDIFYPIVPDDAWMARLAPLGIRTVQLRLKDASTAEVTRQIRRCLALGREHGVQVIINDYWQAALDLGADYIHLGQEDLAGANLPAIKAAGVRLGISSHDEQELETALAAAPDYVALGPVYPTRLKEMKWAPQGLERVSAWRRRLGACPLVAIGGITPDLAAGVLAAGANSVAVITDFFTHDRPEERVRTWVAWAAAARAAARATAAAATPVAGER